jgi:hypothetical protein
MTGKTHDEADGRPEAAEPELLETGQEEVFSRAEVERGRIEHGAAAGSHGAEKAGEKREER